jgi:hypothetical protein
MGEEKREPSGELKAKEIKEALTAYISGKKRAKMTVHLDQLGPSGPSDTIDHPLVGHFGPEGQVTTLSSACQGWFFGGCRSS